MSKGSPGRVLDALKASCWAEGGSVLTPTESTHSSDREHNVFAKVFEPFPDSSQEGTPKLSENCRVQVGCLSNDATKSKSAVSPIQPLAEVNGSFDKERSSCASSYSAASSSRYIQPFVDSVSPASSAIFRQQPEAPSEARTPRSDVLLETIQETSAYLKPVEELKDQLHMVATELALEVDRVRTECMNHFVQQHDGLCASLQECTNQIQQLRAEVLQLREKRAVDESSQVQETIKQQFDRLSTEQHMMRRENSMLKMEMLDLVSNLQLHHKVLEDNLSRKVSLDPADVSALRDVHQLLNSIVAGGKHDSIGGRSSPSAPMYNVDFTTNPFVSPLPSAAEISESLQRQANELWEFSNAHRSGSSISIPVPACGVTYNMVVPPPRNRSPSNDGSRVSRAASPSCPSEGYRSFSRNLSPPPGNFESATGRLPRNTTYRHRVSVTPDVPQPVRYGSPPHPIESVVVQPDVSQLRLVPPTDLDRNGRAGSPIRLVADPCMRQRSAARGVQAEVVSRLQEAITRSSSRGNSASVRAGTASARSGTPQAFRCASVQALGKPGLA